MPVNVGSLSPRQAPTPQKFRLVNLLGGVNNSVDSEFIDDTEMALCVNMIPDLLDQGVLRQREGLTAVVAETSTTSIYYGLKGTYTSDLTTISTIDGTERHTGLTSTARDISWTTFNGADYFCNGTEMVKTSNGTSFSAVSNFPANTKYIAGYNNFLWAFGHDTTKIRWCAAGDDSSWPAANEWFINAWGTAKGLRPFRDVLIAFFDNSFYHLHGFDANEIAITYGQREVGTTAHNSIAVGEPGLFWWAKEGIMYSPDGFQVLNVARNKVGDTLADLKGKDDSKNHAVWNREEQRYEVWLQRDGDQPDAKFYYYPNLGRGGAIFWGTGNGCSATCSGVVRVSDEDRVYIGGGAAGNNVYRQNRAAANDATAAIAVQIVTKDVVFGSGSNIFDPNTLYLTTFNDDANTSVTFDIYADRSTTGTFGSATKQYTLSAIPAGRRQTPCNFHSTVSSVQLGMTSSSANIKKLIGFSGEGYMLSE